MQHYELTVKVTNAKNQTSEAHAEYTTHAVDPETAAREVAVELVKALGPGRVRVIDEDR